MDVSSGEEPSEGLITSDDEFNTSFQQLELEDSDSDIHIQKTPPQSPQNPKSLETTLTKPGKHALTPESKAAAEKNPKRFAAYNLSSRQCYERRGSLSDELERLVQYSEDQNAHIKQSVLLDLLNLQPEQKNILTRAIKASFPHALKTNKMVDYESIVVYTNLQIKSYGRSPVASKELFADDSKDILVIHYMADFLCCMALGCHHSTVADTSTLLPEARG